MNKTITLIAKFNDENKGDFTNKLGFPIQLRNYTNYEVALLSIRVTNDYIVQFGEFKVQFNNQLETEKYKDKITCENASKIVKKFKREIENLEIKATEKDNNNTKFIQVIKQDNIASFKKSLSCINLEEMVDTYYAVNNYFYNNYNNQIFENYFTDNDDFKKYLKFDTYHEKKSNEAFLKAFFLEYYLFINYRHFYTQIIEFFHKECIKNKEYLNKFFKELNSNFTNHFEYLKIDSYNELENGFKSRKFSYNLKSLSIV